MRPIDADALKKKVCGNCSLNDCVPDATDTVYGCDMMSMIDDMPTIEPEQKLGEWVETEPDEDDRKIGIDFSIKCSRCHDENSHLDFNENHEITGKTFWKSRFCPNCGAKMNDNIADDSKKVGAGNG